MKPKRRLRVHELLKLLNAEGKVLYLEQVEVYSLSKFCIVPTLQKLDCVVQNVFECDSDYVYRVTIHVN